MYYAKCKQLSFSSCPFFSNISLCCCCWSSLLFAMPPLCCAKRTFDNDTPLPHTTRTTNLFIWVSFKFFFFSFVYFLALHIIIINNNISCIHACINQNANVRNTHFSFSLSLFPVYYYKLLCFHFHSFNFFTRFVFAAGFQR